MKIVIFGYGIEGVKLYRELLNNEKYQVIGFADNSRYKQGNFVGDFPILSIHDVVELRERNDFSVIIAANKWFEIGQQLEECDIVIEGIYYNGKFTKYDRMSFERLDLSKQIKLYAGDICDEVHMSMSLS